METGVVTQENLHAILRVISQKRRQGVLEVNYAEAPLNLFFVQGKIVEVQEGRIHPPQELALRFERAEYNVPKEALTVNTYSDLFACLRAQGIDEEMYREAVKHRILDRLYGMEISSGVYYSFKVQMVDFDKEFAPHVSVSQILLDWVELKEEVQRFYNTFPTNASVKQKDQKNVALTPEEKLVFNLIGLKGGNLEKLYPLSLLSSYHFQMALLRLHEEGMVVVDKAAESGAQEAPSLSTKLISALEASIDQTFEAEALVSQFEEAPWEENKQDTSSLSPSVHKEAQIETYQDEVRPESGSINRFQNLNTKMLNWYWIPTLVMYLFLLASFSIPVLNWGELFTFFGE